jgi:hypothetical protein
MQSWRGGLNFVIGCNALLIVSLLDDLCVVRKASSESEFNQSPMKVDQRLK